MEQSSTPWRVFDTPADGSAGGATAGPPGSGASAGATPGPTLAGIPNQWLAIGGVLGAIVIGAIAIVVAMSGSGAAVVEGPRVEGGSSAAAGASSEVGGDIVVDVTGAVVTPGVFHLENGARVGDAIEAAGGFSPRVDVEAVGKALNLAAILTDGAQVHVPSRDDVASPTGGSGGSGPGGGAGGGLVNVNTATQAELEGLPGIGPVTAGRIIESRAGSAFRTVDELRERGLVGEKTFEKLKPLITVG